MNNLPNPTLALETLGGLPVLTDDALFRACGVRIAFTERAGGVSEGIYSALNTAGHVGDDPDAVARNRRIALDALGIDEKLLVVPNQVHGVNVVCVREGIDERDVLAQAEEGADGIVVEGERVAALINTADCLSVILVSPTGRFAVAHAGWRGAVAGIAGKTAYLLAAMDGSASDGGFGREDVDVRNSKDGFGSDDVDARNSETCLAVAGGFNAYIGPHIGPECFEVGPEVVEQFTSAFGEDVIVGGDHVDLARAVSLDLMRAGVSESRIANARICTKCNPERYFSYRASTGACGRQAAIACRM